MSTVNLLASYDKYTHSSNQFPTDPYYKHQLDLRAALMILSDAALLAECEVDTYRASGPGGQNRNKVETAVRLRHKPTGLSVIAEESRSQAENRARALRRLRKAIALRVRRPVDVEGVPEAARACIDGAGRLRAGQRDRRS